MTDTIMSLIFHQSFHNRVWSYSFVARCFRSNVDFEVLESMREIYGKLLVEMTVAACSTQAGGYRSYVPGCKYIL
jgi:hypothetical protein